MRIAFACAQCGMRYRVAERLAGKTARCRRCGVRMDLPGPRAFRNGRVWPRNLAALMVLVGLAAGLGIPAYRYNRVGGNANARKPPALAVPAPKVATPLPKPRAGEVLVVVRGIAGDDHFRAMVEGVIGLAGHLKDGRVVGVAFANDAIQARVKPAVDPLMLQNWVDFGKVEQTGAGVLLVVASPLRDDQKRPEASDVLGRAIFDLRSIRPAHRVEATATIADLPPVEDTSLRRYVAATLVRNLDDPDPTLRVETIHALGRWATPRELPALLDQLKSREPSMRVETLLALTERGDPKSSRAIASSFAAFRAEASRALLAIGPPAESATLALLRDEDESIRIDACRVLAEIGTQQALATLTRIAADRSGPEARAARDAADAIVRRGVPKKN